MKPDETSAQGGSKNLAESVEVGRWQQKGLVSVGGLNDHKKKEEKALPTVSDTGKGGARHLLAANQEGGIKRWVQRKEGATGYSERRKES